MYEAFIQDEDTEEGKKEREVRSRSQRGYVGKIDQENL